MSPCLRLDDIATAEKLALAWSHVLTSDAEDGELAPSMRRFDANSAEEIVRLEQELRDRTYLPRPLTSVKIPKRSGTRELRLPSARDRVVERTILVGITPVVDRVLSPASFGYRPGLGVIDAVRRLVGLRDSGWQWVVRTDVVDCFPSIDRNRVILRLEQLLGDPALLDVIGALVRRPVRRGHRLVSDDRGIPQGGSLSPLLANVALDPIDRALLAGGHQVVRYADDLAILARSPQEADAALAAARQAIEREGLRMNGDKTVVRSFTEGFYFLGEECNQRYPAMASEGVRTEPTQKVLYVGVQGAGVAVQRGRLLVRNKDDTELLSVPTGHVARLVLAGSVGLSAGARNWAFSNDIDVLFLSRRGSYLGALSSEATEPSLLRSQLAVADDPERSLPIGRSIIDAKLANQQVLLLRFTSPDIADDIESQVAQIGALRQQLPAAASVEELFGIEGMGARCYWAAFRCLLPDIGFEGRHSRPPPDLVNSALGYAYAILAGECVSACRLAGLDPAFGVLHREGARRPALALDLMEELRPLIVDQVVVELCRRLQLTVADTRQDQARGGVLLTEQGRRVLMAAIEDRLLTVSYHPAVDGRVPYRRMIQLQARALMRTIRGDVAYEPAPWR